LPAMLLVTQAYLHQRSQLLQSYGSHLQDMLDAEAALISGDVTQLLALLRSRGAHQGLQDWLMESATMLAPPGEGGTGFGSPWPLLLTEGATVTAAESGGTLLWITREEDRQALQRVAARVARSGMPGDDLCFLPPDSLEGPSRIEGGLVVWTLALPLEENTPGSDRPGYVQVALRPGALTGGIRRGRFADFGIMETSGSVFEAPQSLSPGLLTNTVRAYPMAIGATMSGWSLLEPEGAPLRAGRLIYVHSKLHPLNPSGRVPGLPEWYLVAVAETDPVDSALQLRLWTSVLTGLGMLLLVLLVGGYLSSRVVEPLHHLRDEVRALARGDLEARARVTTRDELAQLAQDINTMASRLRETYHSLESSAEQAESRANQLAVINQLTSAMTSAMTLPETFESLGAFLQRLGPLHYASLALPKEGDESFDIWISEVSVECPNPFPFSTIRQAFAEERPALVNTQEMTKRTNGRLARGLVLPLVAGGEVIGTLNIGSAKPDAFTPERMGTLTFVAEALAAAIQHNRLYERVSSFAAELEDKVSARTGELEQAQVKLLQTEKFAATGKLAANLAHEINNPLGIIKNHLFLLEQQMRKALPPERPGEPSALADTRKTLHVCREEIDRIARLTRSLLNFYRTSGGEGRDLDLRREVEDIALLLRKGLEARRISLQLVCDDALPQTHLSPDLVRQVFMNILRNAEDAIESDGSITVTLKAIPNDPHRPNPTHAHEFVRVSIADSGKGIPPEHLDKIFDPFFTTKSEEKGTGLGLSVTLGIMTRLGGSIIIESKQGLGTRVDLRFPVISSSARHATATPPST